MVRNSNIVLKNSRCGHGAYHARTVLNVMQVGEVRKEDAKFVFESFISDEVLWPGTYLVRCNNYVMQCHAMIIRWFPPRWDCQKRHSEHSHSHYHWIRCPGNSWHCFHCHMPHLQLLLQRKKVLSMCKNFIIIYTTPCVFFRLIKLSSPNLNYIIGAGAITLYVDIYFLVVPTTAQLSVQVLCSLTPWLTAIGYSLCYGTIVAKMLRVYFIFNDPKPNSTNVRRRIPYSY